jgi:uracil-DNA glycosylase
LRNISNSLNQSLVAQLQRAPHDWGPHIQAWQQSPEGQALVAHVDTRVAQGIVVYPAQPLRALELTPFDQVKVVILGQDPYHGPGQAHGLAFSVPDTQKPPPSLRNLFTELHRDTGMLRTHTDLTSWAQQGVLLLNTALTVEDGQPASHAKQGWEALTQRLVQAVATRPQPCVYLLWGAHAQKFEPLITQAMHPHSGQVIFQANHPSPLSARRPPVPFIGCGHFGKTSRHLGAHAQAEINWLV